MDSATAAEYVKNSPSRKVSSSNTTLNTTKVQLGQDTYIIGRLGEINHFNRATIN